MGTVAATGIFNALAFAGAGFLFKSLDENGYKEEMKRHNLAIEKLMGAKEKWYENQVAKKNEMEILRQQLSDANADINKTNKALENLRKITFENRTFTREPHKSDFYEPSDEMRYYQHVAVGSAGLIGGWGVYKLLKRFKKILINNEL